MTSFTGSRMLFRAFAFLAIAAWGNAQAVACCQPPAGDVPSAPAQGKSDAVPGPMAADHSCCPSGSTAPANGAPSACGMEGQDVAAPCCESPAPAAVSASAVESVPGPALLDSFVPLDPGAPASPPLARAVPPDRPPPYLSLQRLLI